MTVHDLAQLVDAYADPVMPDWVALEFGQRTIGIRELSDAMHRGATTLAGDSGPVAVIEPDPIDHTIAVLAAIAAGRPALLVDARLPDERVESLIAAARATVTVGRPVANVRSVATVELRDSTPSSVGTHDPDAPSTILVTSGSRGTPKLVCRTRAADLHASMCLSLSDFPIGPGDRHWVSVPFAAAPFLTLVMGSIFARATAVFARFRASECDEFLSHARVSSAYMVPTMLRLASRLQGLEGPGWRSLGALMVGGERLDSETAGGLQRHLGSRLYASYGMTEAPRVCEAGPDDLEARPGTVGRATAGRRIAIVVPGTMHAVDAGEVGEVLVGGPDLYIGYVGEPRVTAWHRSEDLGYLDRDGFLYITGRASEVVKIGGNRVSTAEIESALRADVAVANAAVVAIEDALWGARLIAFVVPAHRLDVDALDDRIRRRLPAYMVPRTYEALPELPMDPSGKVARAALRTRAEELPAPQLQQLRSAAKK
jgi:acyl-coenzyme A synthetase/AMP-(fatty) acid ligase